MLKKVVLFTFLFISSAFAADGVEKSETITGKDTKNPVKIKKSQSRIGIYDDKRTKGKYPDRIYDGAKWLSVKESKVEPEFVNGCWKVMEGLYKRNWKDTHKAIKFMNQRFPNSGVGQIGDALKWQVLMLENFDFRYEKQYMIHKDVAKQKLQEAMESKGNEAWEYFILGALMGVDAIHNMRKEEWLKAIRAGSQGISHVAKAKKLAPNFVDIKLGDGLWLYWRSLIAQNLPKFAQFKDERKKGIELMRLAERKSVFLRPTASLALVYTWVEEGKSKWANRISQRLQQKYPDNILNLQVLGRTFIYKREYDNAEKAFKEVLRVEPKNERVHYYFGRLYLRQKKYSQAEKSFGKYLSFSKISNKHRGYANLFLARTYAKQKKWKEAETHYKAALKYGKIKHAKKMIKKMQKKAAKEK